MNFTPYAYRLSHVARHGTSFRRRPFANLHSLLRDLGDLLLRGGY